ncbi:MAG: aminotransferase class I/II-fold pyridoxal phosphate-dependent enzyme [Deltaproteobacteria bacterium]|nr:aminotransferase class I/II-fold pyridoxal phosphate-dependent enzyme [Deltaproteobacteria bacterium]
MTALPASGIREFFDLVRLAGSGPDARGRRLISLAIGEPDFDTPWHVREAAIWALEKGRTGYTPSLGLLPLRAAIADHVETETGVRYDPEREVLVTVGVSEGLDLALRAVVEPGDEVLHQDPCYVSYAPSILLLHGVPVAVPAAARDGFAFDPGGVERAITPRTRALLLNFPANPTGSTLGEDVGRELARSAERHDLTVIADEIYAELTYDEPARSFVSFPGMRERTILLRGFSKPFAMTGFRIGYACGPASLIDAMNKIHQYAMLCAPAIAQEAALEALRHGRQARLSMREQFRLRRNYLVRSLCDLGLGCHRPDGAFYAFPDITSTGLPSRTFALRLLQEQRVAVVPGGAFGAAGEGFVRCAYAAGLPQLEEAIARMREFLAAVKSTRRSP